MGIKQEQKKNLSDSNSSPISLHMSTRVVNIIYVLREKESVRHPPPNPTKPNKTHQL
jgi:hypothetical protein